MYRTTHLDPRSLLPVDMNDESFMQDVEDVTAALLWSLEVVGDGYLNGDRIATVRPLIGIPVW